MKDIHAIQLRDVLDEVLMQPVSLRGEAVPLAELLISGQLNLSAHPVAEARELVALVATAFNREIALRPALAKALFAEQQAMGVVDEHGKPMAVTIPALGGEG